MVSLLHDTTAQVAWNHHLLLVASLGVQAVQHVVHNSVQVSLESQLMGTSPITRQYPLLKELDHFYQYWVLAPLLLKGCRLHGDRVRLK